MSEEGSWHWVICLSDTELCLDQRGRRVRSTVRSGHGLSQRALSQAALVQTEGGDWLDKDAEAEWTGPGSGGGEQAGGCWKSAERALTRAEDQREGLWL